MIRKWTALPNITVKGRSRGNLLVTLSRFLVIIAAGFIAAVALGMSPHGQAATACTISNKLVNSCRPWLGGWANHYPGHTNTGVRDMITDHENRVGRQMDMVHDYRDPGAVLTADDKYYINRPNTILLLNWKPANVWRDADGRNASVNTQIDNMAKSIKAVAPKKVLLVVFHEPEDDVSPGTVNCPGLSGSSGSPTDYVNMWHNTRKRFDALGVNNVVWGVNYMIYDSGTCLVKPLWPGNNYVDWVFADPYVGGNISYTARMDITYNYLKNNSDAAHDFNSKPWGFAEWGAHQNTQAHAYQVYDDARADLIANRYPNLKAYVIFDSTAGSKGGGAVGLADDSTPDPTEQKHYNAFANDPHFTDAFYTGNNAPSDARPTVTLTKPATNATFSSGASVTITGTAADDQSLAKVDVKVDGSVVKTFTGTAASSFSTTWTATSGSHTVTATATDSAGQTTTDTATITVAAPGGQPCTPPSTDYGTVSLTANVAASGTYRLWSRLAASSSTANTYLLEIDGNSCYTVGGSSVPVVSATASQHFANNSSNWIAKTKAGSTMDVTLSSGNHSLKLYGNADGVLLDRLILTQDTSCTPTGTGDNCANPAPTDTTNPVVNITRPTDNTTLTSTVQMAAQASDNVGVTKVEFYVDGRLLGTAPDPNQWGNYNYDLDPSTLSDGSHTITAKAYDAALNNATSSPITVKVGTTQPPSTDTPGDINGDGKVDFLDFSSLAGKYGQSGSNLGGADLNGDGKVDFLDFSILASHYGE